MWQEILEFHIMERVNDILIHRVVQSVNLLKKCHQWLYVYWNLWYYFLPSHLQTGLPLLKVFFAAGFIISRSI